MKKLALSLLLLPLFSIFFALPAHAAQYSMDVDLNSIYFDMNGLGHFTTSYPNEAYTQPDIAISTSNSLSDRVQGAGGHCSVSKTICEIGILNGVPGDYVYFIAYKYSYSDDTYVSQPIPTNLLNGPVPNPSILLSSNGFSNPEALVTKDEGLAAVKEADTASFTLKMDPPATSSKNIISVGFTVYASSDEIPDGVICSAIAHTDQGDFPSGLNAHPVSGNCGFTQGYSDNAGIHFDFPNNVHQINSITYTVNSPHGAYFPLNIDYVELQRNARLSDNFRPEGNAGGPYEVVSGQTIQLQPNITDPNGDSIAYYAWDLNNDGIYDTLSQNPTFDTNNLQPGVYPIKLNVTDTNSDALDNTFYTTITVIQNEAPVVSIVQVSPTQTNVNTTVNASASFTDADSGNTHTASIDWGDGVVTGGTMNEANGTVTGEHQYSSGGTYTVTVTVTDNHNASGKGTASVTILNPQPVTLYPTADAYLKSGSQNENEGASSFVRLQSSGHNRALIKFDQGQIQSAVANFQNYTAKLQVTITDNGNNWGTTGRPISIHRLLHDWTEGNGFIDGNSPSNRGTGSGATWNCGTDTDIHNSATNCSGSTVWNMDNSSLWPFASAASATSTIVNNQTGVVEFDVTGDVQSFVSGANSDYGWLLKKVDEGANGRVNFGTKESGSTPKLILTPQ